MGGIAGIVNFGYNYLHEISHWTNVLSGMAGKIEHSHCDSIVIIEDNAALALTSRSEIKKNDYYMRRSGNIYYLLANDGSDITDTIDRLARGGHDMSRRRSLPDISAMAFYDVSLGRLVLYRGEQCGKPVFYSFEGGELLFSTEINALIAYKVPSRIDTLPNGGQVDFRRGGLIIR